MNEEVEIMDLESSTSENQAPLPTQVSASTPAPQLNLPDQTPQAGEKVAPIAQVANKVEATDPNAVNEAQAMEAKVEASAVKIEIPDASSTGAVVEVKDTDGDGIPDSNEAQAELIKPKELAAVENVQKSKTKIKINFGKKTMPLMLGVIIAFLALVIGFTVGSVYFSKPVYGGNYNPQQQSSTKARVIDGKNNTTIAGNYTYKIPEAYYYDKYNHGVLVYDTTGTFRIYIRGQEGIYDDIANAKTSVRETLKERALDVISIKEVKINKHPYVIAEVGDGLKNRMIAFTSASSTEVFYVEIVTDDDKFNYAALDLADDILTNAVYKDEKSALEDVAVNDVASVVIAAANNYKSLAE